MTVPVTIPSEALAIAAEHAELAGQPVAQWITEAINAHASRQTPRVDDEFDDCGFYSPRVPASRAAA